MSTSTGSPTETIGTVPASQSQLETVITRLYQRLLRGEEKILAAHSVARTLDDLEQIQRWEQAWMALLAQYERTCDHLKEIKQAQTGKEVVE